MAFKFPLQPLVNLKGQKKEVLQMELALKTNMYNSLLGELGSIKEHKRMAMVKWEEELKRGISSQEMYFNMEIINFYNLKEASQLKVISEIEREISQTKKKIMELHKELKVLEKLKEKALLLYNNDISIREQKQIDELTILKYARNI